MRPLAPVDAVAELVPYSVPPPVAPCDLLLHGNEGLPAAPRALAPLAEADPELLRRYPSVRVLQQALAQRHGVEVEQVLVTAGADDALDRACRALLEPGRGLVLPMPTFEMLHVYARLAGATISQVAWPSGAFPTETVLAAVDERTCLAAIISPNNPTGAVATAADLSAVAARVPLVLLDHAYVEFADRDLTDLALELGNVLTFRTLSKAWGLAGLRVGYVVGPAEVVGWLRRVGLPYPVSGVSIAVATSRLAAPQDDVTRFIADVKRRRGEVTARLRAHEGGGLEVSDSQANFVFVRFASASGADRLRDGLAHHGISVRGWPGRADLEACIRITVAATAADHTRLMAALDAVLEGA